jgi:hypothetical protein
MVAYFLELCFYKGNPKHAQTKSYILSIPGSNNFLERAFSVMNNKWSENRNRCQN